MKLYVVLNPMAGAGRSGRAWPQIEAELVSRGARVHVIRTAGAGDAIDIVRSADLSGFDGLVAAGGDGTLFEVVNGLYGREPADRIPLGVIPVGTGNAFARDLGLGPGDWRKAVDYLMCSMIRRVDVGRVTTRDDRFHFINIAGIGFPVDAAGTARRLKVLGKGAYTLATLWQVLWLRSYPLRLEVDGRLLQEDNVFVEVSNTRYTGTHFKIAPRAKMDDGLLDVILLRKLRRLRILRLFPTIYSGRHVSFDEVHTLHVRRVRILAPEKMPMTVDGEFRGETPATIECLERDLELLAPGQGSSTTPGP